MQINELDLALLTPKKQLNPRLWQDGSLDPMVAAALKRIAQDFYQYVGIEFPVIDLVITGSNCNYNWTESSDLDLHLITDYDRIDCDRELEALFDSKRLSYEQRYDLQVRGVPVGLYVEDRERPGTSGGVYSLGRDQWLRQPRPQDPGLIDLDRVRELGQQFKQLIVMAETVKNLDLAQQLLRLIRLSRKLGLATRAAEYHPLNLTYKLLRAEGLLARLSSLVDQLHSSELSLD